MENENTEVIEPEVLDENGNKITQKSYSKEDELKEKFNPARKAVMGVLGGFVTIVTGAMMFCVFLVVLILFTVPMFILSLFGGGKAVKPDIKIFKFKK